MTALATTALITLAVALGAAVAAALLLAVASATTAACAWTWVTICSARYERVLAARYADAPLPATGIYGQRTRPTLGQLRVEWTEQLPPSQRPDPGTTAAYAAYADAWAAPSTPRHGGPAQMVPMPAPVETVDLARYGRFDVGEAL